MLVSIIERRKLNFANIFKSFEILKSLIILTYHLKLLFL